MSQPTNPRLNSLFRLEYPQSVGVYNTYDEAQKVVDHLADARFPVENLCIVGTELRSVERVLGRRGWGTVLGQGLQSGLSTGLMITLFMWLFTSGQNFALTAIYALAIGVTVGVVFAAIGYWISQGKRDFTSVSQTMATKYEVLAEHKVATQARELLATLPGVRLAQFDPATATSSYPPPAYGPPGYGQPGYGQPPQPDAGMPPAGYPNFGYPPQSPQAPGSSEPPAPTPPADQPRSGQ